MTTFIFICVCAESPSIQSVWCLLSAFIFGEQSNPPRICEFSRPPQTFVILIPDFALAKPRIKNSKWPPKNTRQAQLIFYSYSKQTYGLPVRVTTYCEHANGILSSILPFFLLLEALPICYLTDVFSDISWKLYGLRLCLQILSWLTLKPVTSVFILIKLWHLNWRLASFF